MTWKYHYLLIILNLSLSKKYELAQQKFIPFSKLRMKTHRQEVHDQRSHGRWEWWCEPQVSTPRIVPPPTWRWAQQATSRAWGNPSPRGQPHPPWDATGLGVRTWGERLDPEIRTHDSHMPRKAFFPLDYLRNLAWCLCIFHYAENFLCRFHLGSFCPAPHLG